MTIVPSRQMGDPIPNRSFSASVLRTAFRSAANAFFPHGLRDLRFDVAMSVDVPSNLVK
jgi:hypothetical protein